MVIHIHSDTRFLVISHEWTFIVSMITKKTIILNELMYNAMFDGSFGHETSYNFQLCVEGISVTANDFIPVQPIV